jgi:tetratricopeptide (TPR) repeat protein
MSAAQEALAQAWRLHQAGQVQEAERRYRQILEAVPSQANAWYLLGAACQAQNKLDEAIASYEQCLRFRKGTAEVHSNLGVAYKLKGRTADAVAHYREALRLNPSFAAAYNNLGLLLLEEGKAEEAQANFREALRLQPNMANAHCNRGTALVQLGEFDAGEVSLRESLRCDANYPAPYTHLATLLGRRLPEADMEAIRRFLASPQLSDDDRCRLHFALTHVHDARGEYAEAAHHARKAHASDEVVRSRSGQRYNPVAHAQVVDRVLATFTPDFFARVRGAGLDSELPVFVFGLPRSGTSLVEQILASHSQVGGAGELGVGWKVFQSLLGVNGSEPEAVSAFGRIDNDDLRELAQRFLRLLPVTEAGITRVVDKLPDNYLALGVLAALFPRARFIHCRRDLRDVAVSCWVTGFTDVNWTNDLDAMAERFLQYRRLMAYWRQVLPVPILEVSYGALVADLETETRRLVAGCGLEWEPACLAFHETRRQVGTASATQVRQPIYSRSIGRWRHYEDALGPLFARLVELDRREEAMVNPQPARRPEANVDKTQAQSAHQPPPPPSVPLPSTVDSQATAYNEQGIQYFHEGRLEDAVTAFQQALRVEPNYADAHGNLGNIFYYQGRHDEAVASYRRAIELRPISAVFHGNLGNVLAELQRFKEAEVICREAVRLQPAEPGSLNSLGNALKGLGKLDEAAASYREALRIQPNFSYAHHNLGSVLSEQFRHTEAIESYQEAIRLKPDAPEYHLNLGKALHFRQRFEQAVACYRRALELRPDYADAHAGLSVVLTLLGKPEDAAACIQEAVRLKPNFPDAHRKLGDAQSQMGDFAGAEASYRQAARLDPRLTSSLAWLLGGRLPEADVEILHQQVQRVPPVRNDHLCALHAGLAHLYDARKKYAEAAHHATQAKAIDKITRRDRGQAFDPADYARFIDAAIATFTPAFFAGVRGWGLESEVPVFVFGLPRSGTTLVEQILASHSQVHGAGEVGLTRQAYDQLMAMGHLDRDSLPRIAESCLEDLQAHDHRAARVVDKMPENFRCLGLLAMLFPRARFIHCRRDLRDVAVSCWLSNFKQVNWANDQETIAFYFGEYRRLMAHWRQVLPVPIVEVTYENVVADLEIEARRLVAACGLEWEPACLAFHQTRRAVLTASDTQVRQPIYSRSVGRWRNYADALGPLFARLEDLGAGDRSSHRQGPVV